MASEFVLHAAWILPMSAPAIRNGVLHVRGDRIVQAMPVDYLTEVVKCGIPVVHLPRTILLPGLINAHCHLDYTGMAGLLPSHPSFTRWIHMLQGLKRGWGVEDFRASWLLGAHQLLSSGVTTVCNIETTWDLIPEVVHQTPLQVISCWELISVNQSATDFPVLERAREACQRKGPPWWSQGFSPHAPYSTTPAFLKAFREWIGAEASLITMHVGESAEEWEMFQTRSGALHDWLEPQRGSSDCGQVTPLEAAARSGLLGPRFLAVHGNHLTASDAVTLAKAQASVVHCPQSHHYFQHADFPWAAMQHAGVNVCLGTDSLATTTPSPGRALELSLFDEMRTLAVNKPDLDAESILRLTTVNAAKALGLNDGRGMLRPGGKADLIGIPIPSAEEDYDPYDTVLNTSRKPDLVMIEGKRIHGPTDP